MTMSTNAVTVGNVATLNMTPGANLAAYVQGG